MAFFHCYGIFPPRYAPISFSCVSASLSYNDVASVTKAMNNDRVKRFFMGKQTEDIGEVERGTEQWVAMFSYCDAPTALVRCVSTRLSYNQVARVIKTVNIDRTERIFMAKQIEGISEVERRTGEWVAMFSYYDAPTALSRCVSISSSYNQVISVMKALSSDRIKR